MLLGATPTEPTPEPLERAEYIYDGDNNLVKGIVNDTVTYYPGRHYNKEVVGTSVKVQKFYQAAGQTVAVRTLEGEQDTLHWILADHLGSTSVTANADGSWNSQIQYTAFGEIRSKSGVTPSDYRYTGQLRQSSINLYWYNSRWYDGELAHFVQPDNIIPTAIQGVQAFNRFAYVNYNPIRFSDPSGHDAGCTGYDCHDVVQNTYNYIVAHSESDAALIVNLYESSSLPGNTPEERTAVILNLSWSDHYQHFDGDFGDSGFKDIYQDGGDQVGHFLKAVRLGQPNVSLTSYALESLAIGHEMIGDQVVENSPINSVIQGVVGFPPVSHWLFNTNSTIGDTIILNTIPIAIMLMGRDTPGGIPIQINRAGNSMQDLKLTRQGFTFSRAIHNGEFKSNKDAAAWLRSNLCKNNLCSR